MSSSADIINEMSKFIETNGGATPTRVHTAIARSLASKVSHVGALDASDAARMSSLASPEVFTQEGADAITAAVEAKLSEEPLTAAVKADTSKEQSFEEPLKWLKESTMANLLDNRTTDCDAEEVLAQAYADFGVIKPNERSRGMAVAVLTYARIRRTGVMPPYRIINKQVRSFGTLCGCMATTTPKGPSTYTTPSNVAPDLYKVYYPDPDDGPVERCWPRVQQLFKDHIPLRESSKLLKQEKSEPPRERQSSYRRGREEPRLTIMDRRRRRDDSRSRSRRGRRQSRSTSPCVRNSRQKIFALCDRRSDETSPPRSRRSSQRHSRSPCVKSEDFDDCGDVAANRYRRMGSTHEHNAARADIAVKREVEDDVQSNHRASVDRDAANQAAMDKALEAERVAMSRLELRDKSKKTQPKKAAKARQTTSDDDEELKKEPKPEDESGDGNAATRVVRKGSAKSVKSEAVAAKRVGAANVLRRPSACTKPSAGSDEKHALHVSMKALFTTAKAEECKSSNTFACRAYALAKKELDKRKAIADVRKATLAKYHRLGREYWEREIMGE